MSDPELFLKKLYQELALSFKQDYEQIVKEIETFEQIFKDRKWTLGTKKQVRELLTLLYKQRNEYAKKAEHYRKMYHNPEIGQRTIGWRKSRT